VKRPEEELSNRGNQWLRSIREVVGDIKIIRSGGVARGLIGEVLWTSCIWEFWSVEKSGPLKSRRLELIMVVSLLRTHVSRLCTPME
jgi:hypothetical protein